MQLDRLLSGVELEVPLPTAPLAVTGLHYDSRQLQPGQVFVAIRGEVTDGNRYVAEAVARGAVAVVSETEPPPGLHVPWVRVRQARQALALMAANWFGHPARRLQLIGITGTNGKTTTAFLCESVLRAAGIPCGLLGTIEYHVGEEVLPSPHTTPESYDLQAMLARMAGAGSAAAVLEVSSHALALDRTWGCRFEAAVFTNLTQDHLDFHETFEQYREAKRRLFAGTCGHQCRRPERCGHGARLRRRGIALRRERWRGPAGDRHCQRPRRPAVSRARAARAGNERAQPAVRPRERDELTGGRRRGSCARPRSGPGAPRRRSAAASARPLRARGGGPAVHGGRGLRAHAGCARQCTGLGARAGGPAARDYCVRLRRRPGPGQASAHGRGSGALERFCGRHHRQSAQRGAGGDHRGDLGGRSQPARGRGRRARSPGRHPPGHRGSSRRRCRGARRQGPRDLSDHRRSADSFRRRRGGARRPARDGAMQLSLAEIANVLRCPPPEIAGLASGYSIDSRTLRPGEVFFAIRGGARDGHDFVLGALGAGAVAAVIARDAYERYAPPFRDRLLPVADPTAALQQLAAAVRRRWGRKLVAITGSAGKTSTKEMIARVLGARLRVLKTEGNLNNHLGLPLSLLRLTPAHEVAVVEMGM